MTGRPVFQIRWSDENVWKDLPQPYINYRSAEFQLDKLREDFARMKARYGLKYDVEFRVGVTYAKP